MFVVGITGGTAVGKTIFSDYLKNYGALVIDADKIARVVIDEPDVNSAIISSFGRGILDEYGKINRRVLGSKAFTDKKKLDQLNKIMLPRIVEMVIDTLQLYSKTAPPNQVVVIDAPLLIESELFKQTDMIVLVKSKNSFRLERLLQKGFTIEEANQRIGIKLIEEDKENFADYIIDNDDNLEELNKKAVDLCKKIVHLASF
jgi:dephospho-CoA kinase